MDGLIGLLNSRKALVVLLTIMVLVVLLALGHIDKASFEELIKYIIPVWLGSHAIEEGAKKLAEKGK